MSAIMNMVRVGTVSTVNIGERTARVTYRDKGNIVSGPLKVLNNSPTVTIQTVEGDSRNITVTPWMPRVGESVVCLYLPNGESDGFILGGI